MDIIRITMRGYGCEFNRGILPKGGEKKLEESLNNVWLKNLYKKLEEKTKINKVAEEIGLLNGDIEIEVNGEIIIDMPIKSFEALITSESETLDYPKSNGVVLTSVQHQEGVLSDTIFLLDNDFDLSKLKIIKKDIKGNIDNAIVSSLYCRLYYEDEIIPMSDNTSDLRMSRLYLEKTNKKNAKKKNK